MYNWFANNHLILLQILLITGTNVNCLKCWDCTTDKNLDSLATEYCGEPFDRHKLKQYAKEQNIIVQNECSLPFDAKILEPNATLFCQTFIKSSSDDEVSITRSCSYGNLTSDFHKNVKEEYCIPYSAKCEIEICTTDYCNGIIINSGKNSKNFCIGLIIIIKILQNVL